VCPRRDGCRNLNYASAFVWSEGVAGR